MSIPWHAPHLTALLKITSENRLVNGKLAKRTKKRKNRLITQAKRPVDMRHMSTCPSYPSYA